MEYAILTEQGPQMVEHGYEGALEFVDQKPPTVEGEVASLSRYEIENGKIYARYTVEHLPITSKSQIDKLAEAVAKRILGQ